MMFLVAGRVIWRNISLTQVPDRNVEPTVVGWQELNISNVDALITDIEVSYHNPDVLYYGTNNGRVFKLTGINNARQSDMTLEQLNIDLNGGYVSDISASPADDEELLVSASNYGVRSVFHSSNGGLTFEDVSGNLEESTDGSGGGPSVRSLEIVPLLDGLRYFVGTSSGLFSTSLLDGSNTVWTPESSELIGRSVVRMMDYRPIDGRLVVATHGNGVYDTFIPDFQRISVADGKSRNSFTINHAAPNPFVQNLSVVFELANSGLVTVEVYNLEGQKVDAIFSGDLDKGINMVTWDGRIGSKVNAPTGVYVVSIAQGKERKSVRVFKHN